MLKQIPVQSRILKPVKMSKSRKRRNTFPETSSRTAAAEWNYNEQIDADSPSPGLFGYFRDIGVRETIESLLVAVLLALMFRAFESEAFIIPTGSMAPSLTGQHYDLECENCGKRYHTGTSAENVSNSRDDSTHCPICRFPTQLSRNHSKKPDHRSNNGDRILVNKFTYDFADPERYDVIVFKNPHNGKQNYIKRLIGLPGDNLAVENGDIYLFDQTNDGWGNKRIARKPSSVVKHILQVVDDTHHIGQFLEDIDWPLRWQEFAGGSDWEVGDTDGHSVFKTIGSGSSWLRYRHFQPFKTEWAAITTNNKIPKRMEDKLPLGMLISDQYAYNDLHVVDPTKFNPNRNPGLHWVGDIGMECDLEIDQAGGEIALDIVEGGVHFICTIDTATGVAKLSTKTETDSVVKFVDAESNVVAEPTAQTSLGAGSHRLMFVNADDQLHLWVDGSLIEFDAATYNRNDVPMPYFSATDAGDAEPLGIASKGASLKVDRLKVVRDIYYTSTKDEANITNESGLIDGSGKADQGAIYTWLRSPEMWGQADAKKYFGAKKGGMQPMFELRYGATAAQDQFLPMGDNSPNSLDGRFWYKRNYVQRDMLIGQATFVYWPHTVNSPFPFCPNFWEMGFIR